MSATRSNSTGATPSSLNSDGISRNYPPPPKMKAYHYFWIRLESLQSTMSDDRMDGWMVGRMVGWSPLVIPELLKILT